MSLAGDWPEDPTDALPAIPSPEVPERPLLPGDSMSVQQEPANDPAEIDLGLPQRLRQACASWAAALTSLDAWLDFTVCALMAMLTLHLPPQHRRPDPVESLQIHGETIYTKNRLLDNPLVTETISSGNLIIIATIIPLVVAMFLSVAVPVRGAEVAWLRSFFWAQGCQGAAVSLVKCYCGYWRPNFYAECGYNATTGLCDDTIVEPYRSFPSGHAGTAFGCFVHITLRLLGASRVGHKPRRLSLGSKASVDLSGILTLLCLAPLGLAFWVSASRVRDNFHHPADVVGGGVIGSAFAMLWYSRFFHPLFSEEAHLPREAR